MKGVEQGKDQDVKVSGVPGQLLSQLAAATGERVVSVVRTSDVPLTVTGSLGEVVSQLGEKLGARVTTTDDDVVVFYDVIPEWIKAQRRHAPLLTLLDTVLAPGPTIQPDTFLDRGRVVVASLSDPQKRALARALNFGETDTQQRNAVRKALALPDAELRTQIRGEVDLFRDGVLHSKLTFAGGPTPEYSVVTVPGYPAPPRLVSRTGKSCPPSSCHRRR